MPITITSRQLGPSPKFSECLYFAKFTVPLTLNHRVIPDLLHAPGFLAALLVSVLPATVEP